MNTLLSFDYATWLFGGAVGLTLALVAIATLRTSSVLLDPLRRRLRAVGSNGDKDGEPGLVGQIGGRMLPRSEKIRQTLRLSLVQAGWRDSGALALMYALKAALALGLPALFTSLALMVPAARTGSTTTTVLLGGGLLVGWWLPNYLLRMRVAARQRRLMDALPDALDLLVACTEAGLGLNAAIERVAEQLPARSPELADELRLVNSEIRAGVDRMDALRNLATRTGLKDLRGLVSLINHSMRFGTSIANTMRVYAEEFRDRRLQRAEELAATIGTKLVFPLVFCIFPSFFLVAIGPALVGVIGVLAEWPAR
ncbi:MAG: type II secretion system F family protein [Pseudomonadota bacterium]